MREVCEKDICWQMSVQVDVCILFLHVSGIESRCRHQVPSSNQGMWNHTLHGMMGRVEINYGEINEVRKVSHFLGIMELWKGMIPAAA